MLGPVISKDALCQRIGDGKRHCKSFATKAEAAHYAQAMREKHHKKFANHKTEV